MRVAVVAAGMSRFGARPDRPKALFDEAYNEMESRAGGVDGVDEAWIGTVGFGGHQPGNSSALFLEGTACAGAPASRVENACASSAFALRAAVLAIRSGVVKTALVGGVESMTPHGAAHRGAWLGVSGDTEVERAAGLTFPGVYAMMARAHMQEFGTTPEQLAAVAVKNHGNGSRNPKAQFQREITLEKALGAPRVADPLGLFDCCATTDGAACLLLVEEAQAASFDHPVWLTGTGAATDSLALHDRPTLTGIPATTAAARAAFMDANANHGRDGNVQVLRRDAPGLGAAEIDVAEVHDCFTIAEVMAVEDLGFVAKGQGGPATEAGMHVVVNPSGGLKAKGHPLGASGAGQGVEMWEQLAGHAGPRQVQAHRGLTHSVGGSGATCAVHIWEAP